MVHDPAAQRAFVESGMAANDTGIQAGQVDDNVERNPFDTDRWLPQAQDIARRLPQIVAAQAAVAATQAATVSGIQAPSAAQIAGGTSSGTGGIGAAGGIGSLSQALGIGSQIFGAATAGFDFFHAPGQAHAGGDAASGFLGLQQSALEQQTGLGKILSDLRANDGSFSKGLLGGFNRLLNPFAKDSLAGDIFGWNGPRSKPAQGN